MAGSCERGKEALLSIKDVVCLDQLSAPLVS
jgi:hypothetical protein